LVHRDGIVSEKDIEESSADDELILKWLSTKTITQIDNKEIELNYESRRVGVSVPFVGIKQSYMQRKFKIKDKISFDINDFNDISYTCISFVQELYNVMPKNDISTNNPV
jgi:hypothetical protein